MDFPYLLLHKGIWQDLTRGGPERCQHRVSLRGTRRPLAVSFWHICCLRWVPTPQLTEHCNENSGDRVKQSESRHIPSNSHVSHSETGCTGAPISRQFPGLNIFQNMETFSLPTIPLPSPLPFLFSLLPFLSSFFF